VRVTPARLRTGVAVLVLCTALGCATSSREQTSPLPRQRVKLVATETGDEVTLRWASTPGIVYAVAYTTNLNDIRSWKLVPGQEGIHGTGGILTAKFPPPIPGNVHYRLSEKPLTPK